MFNDGQSGAPDGCLRKDFGEEVKKKKDTISAIFFIFFQRHTDDDRPGDRYASCVSWSIWLEQLHTLRPKT